MSNFFDLFPKILYDINKDSYTNYEVATNIFVRIGVIKESLSGISSYYIYNIKDGDTPERLAEKVYGSPEAHWIIMMSNDIVDSFYDWPLNYDEFNKYIINKYRTAAGGNTVPDNSVISWSQVSTPGGNNIYKYFKVIERTDTSTNTTTVWKYKVDYNKTTINVPTNVPYDYYLNLSTEGTYTTYNVDGVTINEKVYGTFQTFYDYEVEQNDSKRTIKIIRPEYYNQIVEELKNILGTKDPMKRTLI